MTKTVRIDGGEYRTDSDGLLRPIATYYVNSKEDKPTEGVNDADRCYVKDTKELYVYDAVDKAWYPV